MDKMDLKYAAAARIPGGTVGNLASTVGPVSLLVGT